MNTVSISSLKTITSGNVRRLAMVSILLWLIFAAGSTPAYCQKRNKAAKSKALNDSILISQKRTNAALFSDGLKEKIAGNNLAAKQKFEAALQAWPDDPASMFELAELAAKTGQFDQAIALMNNAIPLDHKNKWYLERLAQLYRITGDLKAFVKTYRELLKLQPDDIEYIGELSLALLLLGETNEAIDLLNQIETQTGVNEMLSQQKQAIYLSQGKPDKAIDEIKKLSDTFPGETRYLTMLADLYKKNGQAEKALEVYERIAGSNADDPYAHIALAEHFRELGHENEAFASLLKAFEVPQLDAENKLQILQLWFQGRENDSTISDDVKKAAEVLMRVHPESPRGFQLMANYQLQHGQYEEARKNLLLHYDKEKFRYEVGETLMYADYFLQDFETLVKHADDIFKYFPEQPLPYLYKGIALFQLNRYDEALTSFETGRRFVVGNNQLLFDFYSNIGDTQHRLKNNRASDAAYDKALSISGDNALVLNNYAYYLSLRNENLDKAKEMSEKAVNLQPDNPSYLDTYAWVLFRKADYSNALIWIEKALDKSPEKNGTLIEHYGDILYHLGRVDEAVNQWKIAAQLESVSDSIQKKIKNRAYYE